jgi:hypothetical protein
MTGGALTGDGDRELVARAVDGDRACLEKVITVVRDPLYRLALRMTWRPADAEDATQEILIRVITRLASWRGSTCGLVNPDAFCRCARRVEKAVELGRIDPRRPVLATHPVSRPGRDVTEAAAQMHRLHDAAAVLRAHPGYAAPRDKTDAIIGLLRSGQFPLLSD